MATNPVPQEFSDFIEALKSPDNTVRDQAEAQLDQMRETDVLNVITQFFNVMSSAVSPSMKSFVAVILRKVIDRNAWAKIGESNGTQDIFSFILQLFQNETDSKVRRSLCDVISQLSGITEEWPELYTFIMVACSQDNEVRTDGLYLLGEVSSNNDPLIADHITDIIKMLSVSLQSGNLVYQVAAARTAMTIMSSMEVDEIVSTFTNSIPAIVNTIQLVVNSRDEDSLLQLLEDLDGCVSVACSYINAYIPTIVQMCLVIAGDDKFSPASRSMSADVISTLARENGGYFRKNTQCVMQYLRIAVSLITDVEDDAAWESGIFGEEEELVENDNEPSVIGITMVSNISDSLRAAVYKPATQLILECSRSADWKVRRAVYVLMAHISDGCKKQVETDLKAFITYIMTGLNDSHPRVVYVSVQAIAYLSISLTQTFQKKFGSQIVQALLTLMQKNPCLRVQAITASCLAQFCDCDMISKKIFKGSLPALVQWLYGLCSVAMPSVQSEAITAIGFLCRATKDDFVPFFHDIVQGLLTILGGAVTPDVVSVHVSACSCLSSLVSSIGQAVPKTESWSILQFLMSLIEKSNVGDERLNSLLDSAAEIFQYIERPQQVEFLSVMVPYLLRMTQIDVGFSMKQVVTGEDYRMDNGIEKVTMETQSMGKVQMSINTTAIETISNAVRLIHNLIIDAKVFPLVDFNYHEEVRNLVARILPKIFELLVGALKTGGTSVDACLGLYNQTMEALLKQYLSEDGAEERSCIAESIVDMFNVCYESGDQQKQVCVNQRMPIPIDTIPSVYDMMTNNSQMVSTLIDYLSDSAETLTEFYKEVDFDERDLDDARAEFEEAAGEEKNCVEYLLDALGTVIKSSGEHIAPLFQQFILPFSQKYMAMPFEYIKFIGVCPLDDMLDYATPVVGNMLGDMMTFFSANMACEDPSLRQSVLFGLKIIIEKFSTEIMPQAKQIMSALIKVISGEDAMSEDYRSPTDNAVSAVLTLLIFCRSALSPKEFQNTLTMVVEYLPMEADIVEAQIVHDRVVSELMKPNHGVFDNKIILDKMMRLLPLLLVPAYDEGDNELEIVDADTKVAVIGILKTLGARQVNNLIGNVEPEVREHIMNAVGF